jgi:hypothetical protein
MPRAAAIKGWFTSQTSTPAPRRSYLLDDSILVSSELEVPDSRTSLQRIFVATQQHGRSKKQGNIKIGDYYGQLFASTQYSWKDGASFLHLHFTPSTSRSERAHFKQVCAELDIDDPMGARFTLPLEEYLGPGKIC